MTNQFAVEAAAERAESYLDRIGEIVPGSVCAPDVCEAMRTLFESRSGLTRDQYLFSPFGFPPVPVPYAPRPDGTGRVPTNVNVEFARHPVYWLDWETAERRPGEDDWTWQVRLYVELAERGWWDVETGEWYDLPADYEFDIEADESAHNRLASYIAGNNDPEIARFAAIAPADYVSKSAEVADELIETLKPIYQSVMDAQTEKATENAAAARRYIQNHTDFTVVAGPLIEALKSFQEEVQGGGTGVQTWPAVSSAAEQAMTIVQYLFRAVVEVAIPIVQGGAEDPVQAVEWIEQMEVASRVQKAERSQLWLSLLGALREDPTTDARYADLIGYLRSQHSEVEPRLNEVDRGAAANSPTDPDDMAPAQAGDPGPDFTFLDLGLESGDSQSEDLYRGLG